MQPIDFRNHPPSHLFTEAALHGFSATQVRRLLGAIIGQGITSSAELQARGLIAKRNTAILTDLPTLTLERTITSPTDQFQKLQLRTGDNLSLETVIIPLAKPGHVTVCVSSQVGCVMGCTFCATARMTKRRNLQTWEIIEQIRIAREISGANNQRITGVVFMGMGEPFLNYDNVLAAAELLCYPVYGAIEARGITISTVGVIDKIIRFTAEQRRFRLSISLGAATDEKRKLLVPVAARTPVVELMRAARAYAQQRNDRINLAYVCCSGVNVSEEDAVALGKLIDDTPVRIDLIEVNDSTGRFSPPTTAEWKIFRDALTEHVRQPVARRYSGGQDIRAACGTLAGAAEGTSV